jgi:protein-disulfide isomerase
MGYLKNLKIQGKNHLHPGWWVLLGLIILASAAGIFLFTRNQTQPAAQNPSNGVRMLGTENAPITIVEYADFNCPTCKAWQLQGIKDQILAEYAGKVQFIWRDYPVITALSPKAAEAGWCANDQGKFWTYHDLLYFFSPISGIEELESFAAQASLDTQTFNQCLESGKHQADVQNEYQDALDHGFRGTPSFLVNGKPLIGPPSYAHLVSVIDALLGSGS